MAVSLRLSGGAGVASARDFISRVEELDHIPAVNPDYPAPNDANWGLNLVERLLAFVDPVRRSAGAPGLRLPAAR